MKAGKPSRGMAELIWKYFQIDTVPFIATVAK